MHVAAISFLFQMTFEEAEKLGVKMNKDKRSLEDEYAVSILIRYVYLLRDGYDRSLEVE